MMKTIRFKKKNKQLKTITVWVFYAFVLTLSSCAKKNVKKKSPLPNIILILADDLGYADLGYTGCKDFKTPNIDRLAHGGIVCANGYASHSFCAPTRAGIVTGRNQHRFGFQENPNKKRPDLGLPEGQYTLPQLLSKAGYKSALVGKWHLGVNDNFHPLNRGFDEFYGFLSGGHDYLTYNPEDTNKHSYGQPLEHNGELIGVEGYLTDQLTDFGVDFVGRQKDSPYLLFMSYNAPHTPYQAPETYLKRVDTISNDRRRTYAAMVTALDDGVGRLLKTLEENNQLENTLIFFMSDNGGTAGPSNNKPFRGLKGTLLEGGLHVPYLVYWKGKLQPGSFDKSVVSYDVFATALELAQVEIPTDRIMDGRNLFPYLTGEKEGAPHKRIYWKQADHQWAVRAENKKILSVKGEEPYVFDMSKNIFEQIDISNSNKELTQQLVTDFQEWNKNLPPPKYGSTGISLKQQSDALEELINTRMGTK